MEFTKYELYDLLNRPGPLWLAGADLRGAYLKRANLEGADLTGAILQDANLESANLRGATLVGTELMSAFLRGTSLEEAYIRADLRRAILGGANLIRANVQDALLCQTSAMIGAIMPNGKRYDGRYNLPTDLAGAKGDGIDINDPEALSTWYSVSLHDYLEGQKWAKENLPKWRLEE